MGIMYNQRNWRVVIEFVCICPLQTNNYLRKSVVLQCVFRIYSVILLILLVSFICCLSLFKEENLLLNMYIYFKECALLVLSFHTGRYWRVVFWIYIFFWSSDFCFHKIVGYKFDCWKQFWKDKVKISFSY